MNKRPLKKARRCATSSEEEDDASPSPPGGSPWDPLSSLPDLVLARLLSFFLPPSHGLRVLPSHRRQLYHAATAFLNNANDPATCPESFWHDDTDQYGHHTLAPRTDAAVLALRATCRALRDRVDLVLRLPPLSLLVDRLHAWLREHVGPAAPAIGDIEAARRLTLQASALAGRAHALLHQLRLEEVVGEVCREWKIGRAKRRALVRLTRPDDDEAGAGQQPRLRMVHLAHRSDMVGRVACQAIDASLTLSLPGQPHELVEIGLVSELTYATDLTVLLALHTRSTEWCRRLGLSPQAPEASDHHPAAAAAAAADEADGGAQWTTRALIGWSQGEARLHTALLAKLWAALGFAYRPGLVGGGEPRTMEKLEDDDNNEDDDEADGDEVWGGHEVAAVLLGCLGFMSCADVLGVNPFTAAGVVDELAEDDEIRELADAECEERTTARRNERRSMEPLLRGWDQFLRGQLVVQPAGPGRRQALVVWELVARTVERYVGQMRVSHIGHALEVLHGLPPVDRIDQPVAHIPAQVLDTVRVLGCQSFAVRGQGGSCEEMRHTHTCARFTLRPRPSPTASSPADLVLFRCELSSCEDDDGGVAAQLLLITAQACAPGGGDNPVQVLVQCVPFIPGAPHGDGPRVTVATQKLVQVGRALGMTPNNTKAKKNENENENESEEDDDDDEEESESEDLDAGLEDEGAREEAEFARQVASALMFVAQQAAWNGCERFEGNDDDEELTNDEFNLEHAIGRAPLPRRCFTGRTWAYW